MSSASSATAPAKCLDARSTASGSRTTAPPSMPSSVTTLMSIRRPSRAVDAAQSLLFGLLALQNNFIDRDALLAAFNAWVADKSQSLGQILLDRGALTPARHAVLLALVQEHLQQHGFDPERSLAVVTVAPVGSRRPRGHP